MTNIEALEGDLRYVKGAIANREPSAGIPLAIAAYWAAAMAVGFTLLDFAPQYTGLFWIIVGPLGLFYSAGVGTRLSRGRGEVNSSRGHRIMYHFAAMMLAIFSVPLLQIGG